MTQAPDVLPPRQDRVLACGAPALLVLVAAVHLYLVEARALSAWKGGGFGMFSTVDSPGARFLRVYLVEGDSEVPVRLPERMGDLAYDARVLPAPETLAALASTVAAGVWVPEQLASAVSRYHALLPPATEAPEAPHGGRLDLSGIRLLRMLSPSEPRPPEARAHSFQSVRVTTWMAASSTTRCCRTRASRSWRESWAT